MIDPNLRTAEEIEQYLAKRREQDRLMKQKVRKEKREKIGLSGPPAENSVTGKRCVVVEPITVA